MTKSICIIPARGGSKRIPRKNMKLFRKKPIILWSINAAKYSGSFDEIMVSTDDKNIAEYAKKNGANVPFMRTKSNSDDKATTSDVLLEVLKNYNNLGKKFDLACCLYPTAPFTTSKIIFDGKLKLIKSKFNVMMPITSLNPQIWRSFNRKKNGLIKLNFPKNINTRSQDLPISYIDVGQWYWFWVKPFLKTKSLIGNKTGSIVISNDYAQDIETEEDWKEAVRKHKILFK